jgi:hypothetical protein
MTDHVVGHVVEHRISYLISFFFVLLIFLINFFIKFDQVFDVQLSAVSPPRREAASPPLLRCTIIKKVVTETALQLHANTCSYSHNPRIVS